MLLFGPPGAGKGTQAAAVAAASGVPHIATGDMFREHLRSGSELGRLARSYMDRGELVPDDVTIGMLGERISQPDAAGGFVLDGFPRTLDQAAALDRLLAERGARVSGVLDIEVHGDELVRRLAGRLVCRESSHPYHVTDAPPAVPGDLRHRRLRAVPPRRRPRGRDPQPRGSVRAGDAARARALPRARHARS